MTLGLVERKTLAVPSRNFFFFGLFALFPNDLRMFPTKFCLILHRAAATADIRSNVAQDNRHMVSRIFIASVPLN